jgi:hypothetical protein
MSGLILNNSDAKLILICLTEQIDCRLSSIEHRTLDYTESELLIALMMVLPLRELCKDLRNKLLLILSLPRRQLNELRTTNSHVSN